MSSLNNPLITPDYSAGIDPGLSFTSEGYYELRIAQYFRSTGSEVVTVIINGTEKIYDTGGNWGAWNTPFYIKPGDTVNISTSGSFVGATLYPIGVF